MDGFGETETSSFLKVHSMGCVVSGMVSLYFSGRDLSYNGLPSSADHHARPAVSSQSKLNSPTCLLFARKLRCSRELRDDDGVGRASF